MMQMYLQDGTEGYDIHTQLNRIIRTMGKAETRRMCLIKSFQRT